VKENNIGRILDNVSEITLTDAIRDVVALLKTEQTAVSERCLAVADSYFSLDIGIAHYAKIYEELLRG